MNQYKLLTPGPLTTTDTVKAVMQVDHCTWDDDYKQITQRIRCLLYTSPSPRDRQKSRMPSSA